MIIITSENYIFKAEGYCSNTYREKRGRQVTISSNGIKKESFTRIVEKLDIEVTNVSQSQYDILLDIFSFENSFIVEDTQRRIESGTFLIEGDVFKLNSTEDKSEKNYYYSGNIPITKE